MIDTHVHLSSLAFEEDRDEVITRAKDSGVTNFIDIGAGYGNDSPRRALELAKKYPFIRAAVGVHPLDVSDANHEANQVRDYLTTISEEPVVVGIGETGIDTYRSTEYLNTQREWLEWHLYLSSKTKKPIIIHSRGPGAGQEALDFILSHNRNQVAVNGVFHCFGEDLDFAEKLFDIGFYISIPGIVTFKKAIQLQTVVAGAPLDKLLLETDAPFLAPEPNRGKRCESSFLKATATKIAQLKGITLEEVIKVSSESAVKLFSLK
jgi:TatD DNase family protein